MSESPPHGVLEHPEILPGICNDRTVLVDSLPDAALYEGVPHISVVLSGIRRDDRAHESDLDLQGEQECVRFRDPDERCSSSWQPWLP
jgi:hypothetical protein